MYSLDTKQSPYRILYRRADGTCLQIAVGETEKQTDLSWRWIEGIFSYISCMLLFFERNLLSLLKQLFS